MSCAVCAWRACVLGAAVADAVVDAAVDEDVRFTDGGVACAAAAEDCGREEEAEGENAVLVVGGDGVGVSKGKRKPLMWDWRCCWSCARVGLAFCTVDMLPCLPCSCCCAAAAGVGAAVVDVVLLPLVEPARA